MARRLDRVRTWTDVGREAGPVDVLVHLARTANAGQLAADVRDRWYRRMWTASAQDVGASWRDLGAGVLELRRGTSHVRVWQQLVSREDPVALRLALDKAHVHRMLSSAGLPTPEHVEVRRPGAGAAHAFLARTGGPCVVKPGAGTAGGDGTTCGLHTGRELTMALRRAWAFSPGALVERQAPGDVFRLLFVRDELIDVVRRRPPEVVGDGASRIGELIARENQRRIDGDGELGLSLLRVDLDGAFALRQAGLSLRSVPARSQPIRVKAATSESGVSENETYRGPLSPDLVAAAREAAGRIGAIVTGVDVITADPAAAPAPAGSVIAEVNGTPGLHHHYHVADPDHATPVAATILERLLSE